MAALPKVLKGPIERLEVAVSELGSDNHAAFRKTVSSEVANALIFVKRTSRIDASATRVFEECKHAADTVKKNKPEGDIESRRRAAQSAVQSFAQALETAEPNSMAETWEAAW